MARALVIRLSALGDVAMLVPALFSVAGHYPKDEFLLVTKGSLLPVFEHRPGNVKIIPVFPEGKHKGLKGLVRLIRELSAEQIDRVADVHDVFRSKQIRRYFRLKGKKVKVIDKGRREKRALVRKRRKVIRPLKTSVERYCDVFKALGYPYPVSPDFTSIYGKGKGDFSEIEWLTGQKGERKWLGVAPFAKHAGKIYPLELQEQVVAHFAGRPDVKVFLFGKGKDEQAVFDAWTRKYPVVCRADRLTMHTELILMSHLNAMISMDSANMHLASLVGVPVVSVWGATHPYAGFMGWKQSPVNAVQLDMPCRPCSVFGQKPCRRKDGACLRGIMPERVIEKVEKLLLGDNYEESMVV